MLKDLDWKQEKVVHCPNVDCNGMLFQSDFTNVEECSDCKKHWFEESKYVEVKQEAKK